MLIKILIVVAALIIIFLIVVALQPSTFRVVRTATIAAPPEAVFAQVNDFHKWEAWSPWAKLDPEMKQTYEGRPAGVGAVSAWSGNGKVGAGRMTITDSRPAEQVRIRLEFFRPFKGTNTAEFNLKPVGGQTEVTWSMNGDLNFLTKGFSLFMSMDKMIGRDFEKGLAAMKSVTEAAAAK
jgi:carbon monoxide dehydrogenase subunit G